MPNSNNNENYTEQGNRSGANPVEKFWARNGKMMLRPNGSIAKCGTCPCGGQIVVASGHFFQHTTQAKTTINEPPWYLDSNVSAYEVASGFDVQQNIDYDFELDDPSDGQRFVSASFLGGVGGVFSPVTVISGHMFFTVTMDFPNWFYVTDKEYNWTASMCVYGGWGGTAEYISRKYAIRNVYGSSFHNGGSDKIYFNRLDGGGYRQFAYGVPTFSGKYPWSDLDSLWGLPDNVSSGTTAINLEYVGSSSTVLEPNCSGIGDTRYFIPEGRRGYPMSCVLLNNGAFLVPFFSDKVKVNGTIYNVYRSIDSFYQLVWTNNENPSVGDAGYYFEYTSSGTYRASSYNQRISEVWPPCDSSWYYPNTGAGADFTNMHCTGGTMTVPPEFE